MSQPPALRNLSLFAVLLGLTVLELFFTHELQLAQDYYHLKLYQFEHARELRATAPLVEIKALGQQPIGATVSVSAELSVPKPVISKYLKVPSACYDSRVKRKIIKTETHYQPANNPKQMGHNLTTTSESWDTLTSELKIAPIYLVQGPDRVRVAFKQDQAWLTLGSITQSRDEGDLRYEDDTCPVAGKVEVVAQVAREGQEIVLVKSPDKAFSWRTGNESQKLEPDMLSARADRDRKRLPFAITAGLLLLTLILLVRSLRSKPSSQS